MIKQSLEFDFEILLFMKKRDGFIMKVSIEEEKLCFVCRREKNRDMLSYIV